MADGQAVDGQAVDGQDDGLRVLVDATAIPADRGGVGRYVDELLPALRRAGVDVVVVCQRRDVEQVTALVGRRRVVAAPGWVARRPARLVWEQVGLPRVVARTRAKVLHSPHYTMPLITAAPLITAPPLVTAAPLVTGRFARVVTLHDATFFSHPQLHSRVKAVFFRTWTRLAVRSSAVLVVPSRATASQVAQYTGADPARFHVAYHGVDTDVFHPADADAQQRVRASLGLDRTTPYVAFLGTLEPRKNVPALVRGWAQAAAGRDPAPVLVLAGGRGWDDTIEPTLAQVPDGLRVVRPGYLPLADLAPFLSGAQVVAYPSLGEGFGLPVLEAMACGAAVLTSAELALSEVGGDAVAYTGTTAADIADRLGRLLDDAGERDRLRSAGLARAAGFTWDAAAQVHRSAYREAARRAR